jgi:integrase
MPERYNIGKRRGTYELVHYTGGKRQRISLATGDEAEARARAPSLYAELIKPKGRTVKELWDAFVREHQGRAIVKWMPSQWKNLESAFGLLPGDAITPQAVMSFVAANAQRATGTLHTELSRLQMVLNWAAKQGLIAGASYIPKPPQPKPKDEHITREQAKSLLDACREPHLKVYCAVALTTGARNAAILDLTWDRVDFRVGRFHFDNPQLTTPHKGRAIVPINNTARPILEEAKLRATCEYVVEWRGARVLSVKKALKAAARGVGIPHISPHILRHTAAVHMAEAGIAMEEIAQFLGHSNTNTTRRVYARYSPDYLKHAASALEYL